MTSNEGSEERMQGILVFTNQEVLEHKKRDGKYSEDNYCYWEMSRFPKQDFNRFYLAVKGKVQGYFEVTEDNIMRKLGQFNFDSESWTKIEDGEQLKPSQGFRYYLHKDGV